MRKQFRLNSRTRPLNPRRNIAGIIALRARSAKAALDSYDTDDVEVRLRSMRLSAERANRWAEKNLQE